ncbi:metallophosphoesterase [uncultured Clostridium sp.]|uniref:metallophosphoesterase n=1 Tax=uncultured Clostridium sp. TaxID=59620 RepID=UPI0028EC1EAA|nr:metallophosphoesterase [uncultured Clostridium sp.]
MIERLAVLVALFLLAVGLYLGNKLMRVSKYEIKSDKIPKEFSNFKIVHLSDFHSHSFIGNTNKIVKKVDDQKPDIIVMTGDMVNKYDKKFDRFLELAKVLSKKYKIYYIVGNHEQRLTKSDLKLILDRLNKLGIKILKDEKIILKRKKDYLNLYGIDVPLKFYKIRNKPLIDLEEIITPVLESCKVEEYNILLAHNPLYFEKYAKYNVDLILSGHVHGGMIRLPFLGGLLSPERKFFPKYSSGIYEANNKKMIVSRGIGHSKPLIRIFNMPEILSITLLSSRKTD